MYVCLFGGLGNQMFQFAVGKIIASKNNNSIIIDDGYYYSQPSKDTPQKLEIDQFKIGFERFSSEKEKKYLKKIRILNKIKGVRKLNNLISPVTGSCKIYSDDDFSINKKIQNNSILLGYFQSSQYLINNRDLLLEEFTLSDKVLNVIKSTEAYEFISGNSNLTAVHIRRGDYISNVAANRHHGVCSIEYYESAMNKINLTQNSNRFVFFSDDIDWVKEHFQHIDGAYFVDNKSTSFSVTDIYLMSLCDNNIIANSSFSWWGAWLNKNKNKIVIYPNKWTTNSSIGALFVDGWIGL
uniref:Putative glycosyl transferase n=1 Tax=Yersinia pseudotuberculosis TaxID=633 RepID=G4WJB4_YERPU|nr:putative glycosyl transferase [Yersinia pseudotuberculosis]